MERFAMPEEFRTPAVEAYAAERDRLGAERGSEYVHHWSQIRHLIDFNGRVKSPPSCWSFVGPSMHRERGEPSGFDDRQRADYRQFWDWYLPLERNLLALMAALRFFAKADPELCERLVGVGLQLVDLYRRYRASGKLQWLPRRPPNDLEIIDALSQCIARIDIVPPEDDAPIPAVSEWM